jgi:BirA family biotin operon repressor/biotin-[acetyl-CoA-carboxylase] ligase
MSGAALPRALAESLALAWPQLDPLVTQVRWYEAVPTTMDVATEAARSAEATGLLVVADEQSAGRGRRGHSWASPAGGLYFSILLGLPQEIGSQSPGEPSVAGLLTLAAGVAVGEGITTATGLAVTLKWPNDVCIARRKVAGILAEAIASEMPGCAVVLGVGINVADAGFSPDLAQVATSLEVELRRSVDRGALLAAVLTSLATRYRQLLEARYDDVLTAWRLHAPAATGAAVEWDTPRGVRRGVTAGVDRAGALLVHTGSSVERFFSGELRWG